MSTDYRLHTQGWVEKVVVGLNLCPFAAKPHRFGLIRYVVEEGSTTEELSAALLQEARHLLGSSPKAIETTLIIHPNVLLDFLDYNDYLGEAEDLMHEQAWDGLLQLASFHPDYQFAGTAPDEASNYTNRSPYPMLHLLREDSLERALAEYENPESIPERNIERMQALGRPGILKLLKEIQA